MTIISRVIGLRSRSHVILTRRGSAGDLAVVGAGNQRGRMGILAGILEERGENPEIAQYFSGYGVRAGGRAVDRDVRFWIDVLVREGKLSDGQLKAEDILYAPVAGTVANGG